MHSLLLGKSLLGCRSLNVLNPPKIWLVLTLNLVMGSAHAWQERVQTPDSH